MIRQAYWIAGLCFAALVLAKFSPRTGFTSLIRFGETWQERRLSILQPLPIATVPGSNGYDGQFYAQIALDPLLRNPEPLAQAIDAPAYRARRILTPATASIFGLGNPWWTLQAYALLNVFCWFALGWLLSRHTGPNDWFGFARWIGCMFSLGVLDSVRESLVDLPALLLLALAIDSHGRSQTGKSTAWLALANLAKETSLLGSLALYCDRPLGQIRLRPVLLSLVIAALPLALWAGYVQQHFPNLPNATGAGNFTWPLLGLLTQAKLSLIEIGHGNFDGRYTFCLFAIVGLAVQGTVLWRRPEFQAPWWRVGAAYSLLLIFLSSWVWSGYWATCRAVLPLTIAFNLLLPRNRWFWPLWITGNFTLLHAVWRFL